MKKQILIALLASILSSAASAGPGAAWAWDASKITNNGSVQIQSTNGGSTYNAVQNPTGAVAKANQSALTQPPTVIIQATSGGYAETYPMMVSGAGAQTAPTCPAGYTAVFTATGYGYASNQFKYNVGGTRWNLIMWYSGSYPYIGFMPDNQWYYNYNGSAVNTPIVGLGVNQSTQSYWGATLCSK